MGSLFLQQPVCLSPRFPQALSYTAYYLVYFAYYNSGYLLFALGGWIYFLRRKWNAQAWCILCIVAAFVLVTIMGGRIFIYYWLPMAPLAVVGHRMPGCAAGTPAAGTCAKAGLGGSFPYIMRLAFVASLEPEYRSKTRRCAFLSGGGVHGAHARNHTA